MSSSDESSSGDDTSQVSIHDDTSPRCEGAGSDNLSAEEPITSPSRPSSDSPIIPSPEPPSSDRPADVSSPLRSSQPTSSPPQSTSSGSDCGSGPHKRRKVYEFSRPEVPDHEAYWPPSALPPANDTINSTTASGNLPQHIGDRGDGDVIVSSGSVDFVDEAQNVDSDENVQRSGSGMDIPLEPSDADLTDLLSVLHGESQHMPSSGVDDNSSVLSDGDCDDSSSSNSSVGSSSGEESSASGGSRSDSIDSQQSDSSDAEEGEPVFDFGAMKIYDGCNLSVDEGVYLIMDLFMTQKLTKTVLEGLLKVVHKFMPESNNMPRTMHSLLKYVENICPPVPPIIHFYCKTCLLYIGLEEKLCTLCGDSCNKFYQLPLASQIKSFFENLNLADFIDKYAEERRIRQSEGKYHDLCDGSEYQKIRLPGKYSLSLLGHTDGIKISKSSNVSLWLLEFVLSDVEPKCRFNFVLIAGVWVDNSKPNMHCYLEPFAKEFQELAVNGVKWFHPKTKHEEVSLVVVPCFCGDAPVRADLQNILSCGGKHCCNCCEEKMLKLPSEPVLLGVQKKKRKRVFFPRHEPSPLRTAEKMVSQGNKCREILLETGKLVPQKGVKGSSILSHFPSCDPSTAVYPEYMHGIYGIVKQMMSLWFESDLRCNLKSHRKEIDVMLGSVKRPDNITRNPTSTQNFEVWKANECRSFLLFTSVIVLDKFMGREYMQHWILLVASMFLLLQDCVLQSDIQKANIMLKIFLRDFPKLYDAKSLTYNLHNLCHYGLSVARVGPLWAGSAFHFEDFNGLLTRRIHGTKNQGMELVKTVQLFQGIQLLKGRFEDKASSGNKCANLRSQIDKPRARLSAEQTKLLSESDIEVQNMFYRADISGQVFTSNTYVRQQQKNNYTVCYNDRYGVKRYGEISVFIQCTDGSEIAFIDCFEIEHVKMFYHESGVLLKHIIPVRKSNEVQLIPLKSILFKVFRVNSFVCVRPNKHEVNL